jgi:superfamily II DNA or RNA helicase
MNNESFNPEQPGQLVRLKNNPGKQGVTTGKAKKFGRQVMVEVEFSPSERTLESIQLLELCKQDETAADLLAQGRFGGPEDLRRILTLEKVKGELTNIFYSMETSQTDFYPHQFKPVLKFLNSTQGRLLIADEVGLGKTIESVYIWKELQVREQARRLLIICPAILRQKWKDDLRQKFNIKAKIVDTKELITELEEDLNSPQNQSFIYIIGLEGLRQGLGSGSNWDDPDNLYPSAQLARILDSNPATESLGLFDLVVVDEAQVFRNPETASHRLGKLLRDSSRHFLLLTATPIQTKNSDLYNLLRLIDQDVFYNEFVFESISEANRPIVRALSHLWSIPSNVLAARQEVATALQSHYFSENTMLESIYQRLKSESIDEHDRIELGYKLEKISLLGQYISRSRKRDVLENQVKRNAQTLIVRFSDLEQEIYHNVSWQIRSQCYGKRGTALFALITRQRQMTSCMVAAFRAWKKSGVLEELSNTDLEEYLWEDFGRGLDTWEDEIPADPINLDLSESDLEELAINDSKYNELVRFIRQTLNQEKHAKFVIFAYFRGTLHYLLDRLREDGVESCAIMGSMGDAKWDTVNRFRDPNGPIVLLSSEVGSEGIDLQHCRFIINYDLPWNPMRVEQRIGRLDRLGQKADSIVIVNFSLIGTIEEKVLERLYKRIDIFKDSIGDLEEILGPMTEKLLVDLFQQDLTPDQVEARVQQTAESILKQRQIQNELTENAVNLLAFSNQFIQSVKDSKEQGHWLQPDELRTFTVDFLERYYSGTTVVSHLDNPEVFDIALSNDARIDFRVFLKDHKSATHTSLGVRQVPCFFNPKLSNAMGRNNELIEPTHPLIQWIRKFYESDKQALYPLSAIELSSHQAKISPGLYAYMAQRWTFSGLKTESRIAFRIIRCADEEIFSGVISERTVMQAIQWGEPKANARNLIDDLHHVSACLNKCETSLESDFDIDAENFEIENKSRCDVQIQSVESFLNRKYTDLEEQIDRIQTTADPSKIRIIPALKGKLKKIGDDLKIQRQTIEDRRSISIQQDKLAEGILFIKE